MAKPFLLQFAKPCVSPERFSINTYYTYDEEIDMVRWLGSPDSPLVINILDLQDPGGPKPPPPTKKADLEKGEDQKDHRMWMRY